MYVDGPITHGILRKSANAQKVKELKAAIDSGTCIERYHVHALPRAIYKIKHLALSLDANIAVGFALCYISHLSLVSCAIFSTGGNALTDIYIYIYI